MPEVKTAFNFNQHCQFHNYNDVKLTLLLPGLPTQLGKELFFVVSEQVTADFNKSTSIDGHCFD